MKSLFLLLSFPLLALTQSNTPPCVASCEKTSPAASFCDGTETGTALDSCECQSLIGSNLITCIKACPSDQVSWFASQQPASCRSTLFPGVSVSSATTSTAAGNGGSGSTNTATVATSSSTSAPSSSSSPTPSQSAKAGGGSGAAGKNMVLNISLATAVMVGVFALLML